MSTKAWGGELVIATGNRGKLAELRALELRRKREERAAVGAMGGR